MEPQTGSSIRFSTFALELPSFLFLLCSSSCSSWLGPWEAPVYMSVCMSVVLPRWWQRKHDQLLELGTIPSLMSLLTGGNDIARSVPVPDQDRYGMETSRSLIFIYFFINCFTVHSLLSLLFKLYRSSSNTQVMKLLTWLLLPKALTAGQKVGMHAGGKQTSKADMHAVQVKTWWSK